MIIVESIKNLNDWKLFLSNRDTIKYLAQRILKQSGFSVSKIERINIGTNAVFDLGNFILKIYAVSEDSNPMLDCKREVILSNILQSSPYHIPSIVKTGYINDRYTIYYNIIEKIEVLYSFADIINSNESSQRRLAIKELHSVIEYLHTLDIDIQIAKMYSKSAKSNIIEADEYARFLKSYTYQNKLNYGIVHSDLSESNMYYDSDGKIVILDFEDWMYAPSIVEYPTICIELLREPQVVNEFINRMPLSKVIETLIAAILLHHESERLLKLIALQKGSDKLPSVHEMKTFLSKWLM